MKDLIARLEAATEGSRELDAEIAKLILALPPFDINLGRAKHYTTNLQDAVGLVPEGYVWTVTGYDEHGGTADAVDYRLPYACVAGELREIATEAQFEPPDFTRDVWEARSPTPALAVVIAALKAWEAGA